MKDGESWILYTASPQNLSKTLESREDVEKYIHKVETEQKEICCTCKHLFDRIFFHRLEGMAALTEECVHLFGIPYLKKIEDKRKPGKDDKKGKK
jgi:hypothetical protein